MVLVQKWPFFLTCILKAIQARKVFFTVFQNEKTSFQGIKKKSSKSRKIAIFPKGLTHCFGPKIAVYPTSFFQVKEIRKMSFKIFQKEKTPIQGIRTRSSKSRKIALFPKGLTHSFGPKWQFFQHLFFQAKQGRKKSFTKFYNEKTPFQAIKKEVQKVEKLQFFLRG